jgi:hypothetical protein
MLRAIATTAAMCLVGAICTRSAQAGLITNGSFESPVQLGESNGTNFSHSVTPNGVTGWTINSGGVQVYWPGSAGDGYTAFNGNQVLDLVGVKSFGNGDISQSFATTVGTHYTLSFVYMFNPNQDSNALDTADVKVTGTSTLLSASLSPSFATFPTWSTYSTSFVADSTTTTLDFRSTLASVPFANIGVLLDNVSVSAIPEPASLIVWSVVACGIVVPVVRRRRRAIQSSN